jgi:hypothetical protein
LNLPESARFDVILKTPKDGNLGAALTGDVQKPHEVSPRIDTQTRKLPVPSSSAQ